MNYEKDLTLEVNPTSGYKIRAIDESGESVRIPITSIGTGVPGSAGKLVLDRQSLIVGSKIFNHNLGTKYFSVTFQDSTTGAEGLKPGIVAKTSTTVTISSPVPVPFIDIILQG